eukprot:TRINITY_DN3590_c0_g1_i1.p1 TRINITY_DN3590_c0_g1~~TRINITY_DN3590_c0_g1_i1.p1  ORF type:complete len:139 (-),score=21.09 TRINITY_DN3590_c0_g1_i1:51-467(-)
MNFKIFLVIFLSVIFYASSADILRCYIEGKSCVDYSESELLRSCGQSMSISETCQWRPDGLDPTSFVQVKYTKSADESYTIYSGPDCSTIIFGPIQRNSCRFDEIGNYGSWLLSSSGINIPFLTLMIVLLFLSVMIYA